MSKKPHKKKNINTQLKPTPTKLGIVPNIILLISVLLLIGYAIKNEACYQWVQTKLIKDNLTTIKKHKEISFEKKVEAKLGGSAVYLHFVKKNTPDTAIILFPTSEAIEKKVENSNVDKKLLNKVWVTNLLYPRQVVYEREKESSELYENVTHVAVVNHWGYEKFGMSPKGRPQHTILTINK